MVENIRSKRNEEELGVQGHKQVVLASMVRYQPFYHFIGNPRHLCHKQTLFL